MNEKEKKEFGNILGINLVFILVYATIYGMVLNVDSGILFTFLLILSIIALMALWVNLVEGISNLNTNPVKAKAHILSFLIILLVGYSVCSTFPFYSL